MTEYKPGTVAKATVRGVPDQRVMRHKDGGWFSVEYVEGFRHHRHHEVTDVRPLIVLDPSNINPNHANNLVRLLRDAYWLDLADQIEEQTRPAIEEPKGLGAVVEDADGSLLTRAVPDSDRPWVAAGGHGFAWADVNPVRVLSEGVQP